MLASAAEIGFAWDGGEQGWFGVALLPIRMLAAPVQHFRSAVLQAWQLTVTAQLAQRKGFRGFSSLTSKALYNYLSLLTCEREIKCCQEPF